MIPANLWKRIPYTQNIDSNIHLTLTKASNENRAAKIQFSGSQHQNYVSLSIQDNGIGIPLQDLRQAFYKGFPGHNGTRFNKLTSDTEMCLFFFYELVILM